MKKENADRENTLKPKKSTGSIWIDNLAGILEACARHSQSNNATKYKLFSHCSWALVCCQHVKQWRGFNASLPEWPVGGTSTGVESLSVNRKCFHSFRNLGDLRSAKTPPLWNFSIWNFSNTSKNCFSGGFLLCSTVSQATFINYSVAKHSGKDIRVSPTCESSRTTHGEPAQRKMMMPCWSESWKCETIYRYDYYSRKTSMSLLDIKSHSKKLGLLTITFFNLINQGSCD